MTYSVKWKIFRQTGAAYQGSAENKTLVRHMKIITEEGKKAKGNKSSQDKRGKQTLKIKQEMPEMEAQGYKYE